jgi:hypothetical protein
MVTTLARMKHLALALVALTSFACTRGGGGEDDAYELVKSRATKDLNCSDVDVKKMAQDGAAYEYLATGCDDIYTYAVECSARCEITAGVRGRGLGGLWNAADKFISGVAKDIDESNKRHEEMRARHDKMREAIESRR